MNHKALKHRRAPPFVFFLTKMTFVNKNIYRIIKYKAFQFDQTKKIVHTQYDAGARNRYKLMPPRSTRGSVEVCYRAMRKLIFFCYFLDKMTPVHKNFDCITKYKVCQCKIMKFFVHTQYDAENTRGYKLAIAKSMCASGRAV